MRTLPWLLTAAGLTLLTGCVTSPDQDSRICVPADTGPNAADIARKHRQLAVRARETNDLAAAARAWSIVTLLQPSDESAQSELATVRAAISRGVDENWQAANSALSKGDKETAGHYLLKLLALSPSHVEAARALREIEKQQMTSIANGKVARAKLEGNPYRITQASSASPAGRTPSGRATEPPQSFDLEQRLEMFKAGDVVGGLAEFRRYVESNPKDVSGRKRIAQAVYDRGRQFDTPNTPENALAIYEQAIHLRGEPAVPAWKDRVTQLRKGLAASYYDKGMAAFNNDLGAAIKNLEASLRFDPKHTGAALKLREARQANDKLKGINTANRPSAASKPR